MLKWIRPAGAVGFLVLITAIGLFWWMLADWLLKVTIESGGTKMVGARVELSSADLTFSPLGFHLENLQVTNPKQPMQNMVQFGQITGSLELLPLLMGQVIVEEMSATGVRLDTERKTSGAVQKTATETKTQQQPDEEKSKSDLSATKDKLPSVDDILAKEPIATLEKTKAFGERINTERADFEKNLASLPDEAKLKQHEKRVKELTESKIKSAEELKKRKQDLKTLKNEIRADRDALRKVRDQLKNAKGELNQQYYTLKNAPAEDWDRLKSRYSLNATGAGNITGLLFGDNAQIWLTRLLAWAEQAQSLLPSGGEDAPQSVRPQRGTGHFINFAATNPLPDFLIRKAKLGLEISAGNIDLEINDATHQPHILGRPMRLHAAGNQLQNADEIKIDGVIDHVKPNATKDSITWSLTGFKMADVSISKSSSLPLTLTSALANFKGDIEIKDQTLAADVDAKFKNANWSSTATEGWSGRVAETLTTIRQFNLDGKLQGDLSSPKIALHSDLDEQLKQAVAGQLKSAQKELENKFKARLNEEVASMAGPYKDQLTFLTDKESSLDQRINNLDKMLKAELKSAADTKKQETKDKLKDKLKGLNF